MRPCPDFNPNPMQVKIHTQNFKLNGTMQEKVNRTVEKLCRMESCLKDEATEVKINLQHEESRSREDAYSCEIIIFAPGSTLTAESHADKMETAIDEVESKMKKQIEHYKSKRHHLEDRK